MMHQVHVEMSLAKLISAQWFVRDHPWCVLCLQCDMFVEKYTIDIVIIIQNYAQPGLICSVSLLGSLSVSASINDRPSKRSG